MLDVQRLQPALLPHRHGDEIANLDELRFGEMLMEPIPHLVVGLEVPGDRLGIRKRRLLARAIALRALEIQQVQVILLDQASFGRFDRPLIAAVLAPDGFGDVHPAELFDAVVEDAAVEDIAPSIGEGPEDGRHVGADGLALRTRGALPTTALKLVPHLLVANRSRFHVADALFGHDRAPFPIWHAGGARCWISALPITARPFMQTIAKTGEMGLD